MRRRGRTYLIGAASAAGVLAYAITPAAGAAITNPAPPLAKCKGTLTTQLTPADLGLPPANGKQTGKFRCKKGLGKGSETVRFKTNATSGNLTGTFVIKFKKKIGSVHGKFTVTPQEGSLGGGGLYSPSTFGAVGYAGTLKIKGGTGIFNGLKGTGTIIDSSTDGIHFKVKEKIPF